jgi:energy-coupling factor transport system permease protein
VRLGAVPGAILLASVAATALLARHTATVAAITAILLAVCLRAPVPARLVYVMGAVVSGLAVVIVSPFLWLGGGETIWVGPTVPVIGQLDVTTEELAIALHNGFRLTAVGLAFSAYALLLDHDRLVSAVPFARRSALAVALATRLVPTLERDARGLTEAVRGRGVSVEGIRGHGRLLSPLVAGSLERATMLAEAMEARGFGRPGASRAPQPTWTTLDRVAVACSPVLVLAGALWL